MENETGINRRNLLRKGKNYWTGIRGLIYREKGWNFVGNGCGGNLKVICKICKGKIVILSISSVEKWFNVVFGKEKYEKGGCIKKLYKRWLYKINIK